MRFYLSYCILCTFLHFPVPSPPLLLVTFSSFPLAVSLWHREGEERRGEEEREGGWVGVLGGGDTQYKTLRLRKRLCKHTLSLLYICFSLFLSLTLSFTPMRTLAHFILSSSLLPLPSLILFITECNSVHQTMGSTFGESVWARSHACACVCESVYACEWDRVDVGSVWKHFPASPPDPVSQLSKPGVHGTGQVWESVHVGLLHTYTLLHTLGILGLGTFPPGTPPAPLCLSLSLRSPLLQQSPFRLPADPRWLPSHSRASAWAGRPWWRPP